MCLGIGFSASRLVGRMEGTTLRLIDWMRMRHIDDAEMGRRVGIGPSGLRKIKYGERVPSFRVGMAIERVTDGMVSGQDLLLAKLPDKVA